MYVPEIVFKHLSHLHIFYPNECNWPTLNLAQIYLPLLKWEPFKKEVLTSNTGTIVVLFCISERFIQTQLKFLQITHWGQLSSTYKSFCLLWCSTVLQKAFHVTFSMPAEFIIGYNATSLVHHVVIVFFMIPLFCQLNTSIWALQIPKVHMTLQSSIMGHLMLPLLVL